MKIYVTRGSVCMGDDVFDNSRDIEFATNASVGDIIPELNASSFFPSVSGNDVMWAVENARKERILEYYTKPERTDFKIPENTRIKDVCGDKPTLHCVYYSSYK